MRYLFAQLNSRRAGIAALVSVAGLAGCGDWYRTKPAAEARPPAAVEKKAPEQLAEDSIDRAKVLKEQGLAQQALVEFERAIESNPRLTVAYLGAGDIYRERGDYNAAESRYAKAAEIEPSNFDAQYLHGLTLQLLERVTESIRAYLRALSIRPDDFNANLNLATAYLQVNEPTQALPYAQRAVRIDSQSAAARTNLGAVYSALSRHDEAIVEYQQAAELTELSAPLLLNLADSLQKVGRYAEAVNTLKQLIRTEPSANAYERLGAALFRSKEYDEALVNFRKAVEIDANHFPALNGIGVCQLNRWVWSDQKDEAAHDEAMRVLRRSLQIEPRQPKIMELVSRYK
ncbi:MAG: tetratricopeptide repeat protein [Phycisphaerales bacterium]|nr:tetratricopeptide repeat protein [Phycisphaerales bacterium]